MKYMTKAVEDTMAVVNMQLTEMGYSGKTHQSLLRLSVSALHYMWHCLHCLCWVLKVLHGGIARLISCVIILKLENGLYFNIFHAGCLPLPFHTASRPVLRQANALLRFVDTVQTPSSVIGYSVEYKQKCKLALEANGC